MAHNLVIIIEFQKYANYLGDISMRRSKGNLTGLVILTAFTLCILTSCTENNTTQNSSNAEGSLTQFSECKYMDTGNIHSYDHTSSEDCIDYVYTNDGTLTMTHVNSAFNCCPGELTADITISNNKITIEEHEEIAGCHCNCLYDIEYRIDNLTAGIYTIEIITPYVDETEYLEFTMDLTSPGTGSFCITRNTYPWGL